MWMKIVTRNGVVVDINKNQIALIEPTDKGYCLFMTNGTEITLDKIEYLRICEELYEK